MELTLRITDANDLSKFAGLLSALFPLGASTTTATAVATPAPTRRGKTTAGATPEPIVAEAAPVTLSAERVELAPATATATATEEATTGEITDATMRALATAKIQANSENGAKVKAIVCELGGTAISNVPAENRAKFIERVSEL